MCSHSYTANFNMHLYFQYQYYDAHPLLMHAFWVNNSQDNIGTLISPLLLILVEYHHVPSPFHTITPGVCEKAKDLIYTTLER